MQADKTSMAGGDDLYSDEMGTGSATPPDKDKAEKADDGRDSEEAILPRSICAGMDLKVGDKINLEVTAIHDKEFSVKYSPDEDEDDADKGGEEDKAKVPAGMAAGGDSDGMYD